MEKGTEGHRFFSTREVAEFLDVNEKVVYGLIANKGLPATKVTGKWLFPRALVEQWLESSVTNHPGAGRPGQSVLVVAGSNDILLEKTLALYNRTYPDLFAVFGNVGSSGGLRALGDGLCQVAGCHLLQGDDEEYNFAFAASELPGDRPAVVNFCRREQGLVVAPDNPRAIRSVADLGREGMTIANRPEGTGTRLLLDRELEKARITGPSIPGYEREFRGHLDVALEVRAGRADAAPAIRTVAPLLGLDFVPLRWERYDLVIPRERFFDEPIQRLVGLLLDQPFRELAAGLEGYDLSGSGKTVFPRKIGEGNATKGNR